MVNSLSLEVYYLGRPIQSTSVTYPCANEMFSTDLEAPIIDRCPGDIKTISTQRLMELVLPGVKVTDNVGVHNFLTNIQNGSEVTFGQHNITYTASDKAGNKAYCRFRITIAGTNNFRDMSRIDLVSKNLLAR